MATIVVMSFLNLEFRLSNVLSINVLPDYIAHRIQQRATEIMILRFRCQRLVLQLANSTF